MISSTNLLSMSAPRGPGFSATTNPPPALGTALTLYTIEEQLAALSDTLDIVPADQEDELVACLGEALIRAIDKRDSMGRFLAHLDSQIAFADAEIRRLEARKQIFTRILERTESYIVRIIQSLGQDSKGKWQKLEGRTVTFSLRRQPPSVAIDAETDVPNAYRRTTIKMSATLWEELLDSIDINLAARVIEAAKRTDEVSKSSVKEAVERGIEVPGVHLVADAVKLKRG
jgi:hypothetical protein